MRRSLKWKAFGLYADIFQHFIRFPLVWDKGNHQFLYISNYKLLIGFYLFIILVLLPFSGCSLFLILQEVFLPPKSRTIPLLNLILLIIFFVLEAFICAWAILALLILKTGVLAFNELVRITDFLTRSNSKFKKKLQFI